MKEEWKDVKGFEGLFQVSNTGKFFSKRSGRILKQHTASSGYVQVTTKIGGREGVHKCFKMHREVANCFLGEPSKDKKEWAKESYYGVSPVNHIDGDKQNNHYTNLEWSTGIENNTHYLEELGGKGRVNKVRHPDTKLTDSQVREIREYSELGLSQRVIAKKYNVSRSSINNAVNGYRWVI